MKTNLLKISLLAIASFSLLNIACAGEFITNEKGTKIYTEGFNIKSKTELDSERDSHVMLQDTDNTSTDLVGSVGDYYVINGDRPKNIVAYVEGNKGALGYFVTNEILVRCRYQIECVPLSYNPVVFGDASSNLYIVKVNNFEEWQQAKSDLKNLPNVLKVNGIYDYGMKAKAQ